MDRRAWLLALVLGALMSGPLVAGPVAAYAACSAATLDTYLSQTCAIGDLTVKGFSYSSYSSTGDVIPASAIFVQPYSSPQGPHLRFYSEAFSVGAGHKALLELVYNIDPPPVIIWGFDEEMSAETPEYPGFVTIDTWLCVGGTFPGCATGVLQFLQLAHYGEGDQNNRLTDSIVFPPSPPVYVLGVWHTITLDGGGAGGGGSASFAALENQAYTIPEPGTWLLLGCGLLSLALLRRQRAG
jgi:hypothetical protein